MIFSFVLWITNNQLMKLLWVRYINIASLFMELSSKPLWMFVSFLSPVQRAIIVLGKNLKLCKTPDFLPFEEPATVTEIPSVRL